MQLPLLPLESKWKPLLEWPDWGDCPRVGIDTETRDPYLKTLGPSIRRGGYIAGVSVAIDGGPSFYLPIRHEGGDNFDEAKVISYLRDQARKYRGTIVGANLNYDMDYLEQRGITFPHVAWYRDVQVADPLINELYLKYDLDTIGKRWGLTGKDESLLLKAARDHKLDPKKDLHKLPARYVGEYAEWDAELPLKLITLQEAEIDRVGLRQIYDLECRVQPVLLKMRRRGIRIDLDKLAAIETWTKVEEQKALDGIRHLTGVKIDSSEVWKKGAIVPLMDHLGIRLNFTAKTNQPQIDQALLEEIDHDAAKLLLRARKVNKLRTTFAASIRDHMVNGRIHTTFNQLRHTREGGDVVGARYGRLSCENPNLQQQPSKDEFAKMWRSIYVPDDEGQIWFAADYSQQEPRLLTHFAEEFELVGAKEAAEQYRNNPKMDNHKMVARMCGIDRDPAKTIYLGYCYGMGPALLADRLGLPTKIIESRGKKLRVAGPEAEALFRKFDQHVPYVKLLANRFEEIVRDWGYIETIYGRHCHFPEVDGKFDWCYKAINRLIQGSAGDQIKLAMVAVDAAGLPLQLQVHDELDGGADSPEEAAAVAEVMTECLPLRVPSRVDLALGPSWGEAVEEE